MTDDKPLLCLHCGARLAFDPNIRTPKSAWHAPENEDEPTACVAGGPGHTPDNYRISDPGVGH